MILLMYYIYLFKFNYAMPYSYIFSTPPLRSIARFLGILLLLLRNFPMLAIAIALAHDRFVVPALVPFPL